MFFTASHGNVTVLGYVPHEDAVLVDKTSAAAAAAACAGVGRARVRSAHAPPPRRRQCARLGFNV